MSLVARRSGHGINPDDRFLPRQVDVPDFLAILDIVKPREGELFVDLGSGAGRAVLASSCGFPEFSKVFLFVRVSLRYQVPGNTYGKAFSTHADRLCLYVAVHDHFTWLPGRP